MTNIGTTIGAIVGVFIALLVGLSLFGEVSDQTAELGEYTTEGYQEGKHYHIDHSSVCTTTSLVPLANVKSIDANGGIAEWDFTGPYFCNVQPYGTEPAELGLTLHPDVSLRGTVNWASEIGQGAKVSVALPTAASGATPSGEATIIPAVTDRTPVSPGGERVVSGRDISGFIALEVILQILPTVVLVGLLSAGGVLGGFIGRSAGGRFA